MGWLEKMDNISMSNSSFICFMSYKLTDTAAKLDVKSKGS